MKNRYLYIVLILYSLLIIRLIVFKYPPGVTFSLSNANLIPLKTILSYISGEPTREIAMRNLLGNIAVLIPFGFILVSTQKRLKWKGVLLVGLITGIILELLQILFGSGIFDIDDIILNSLGVIIGYLLFTFLKYILK